MRHALVSLAIIALLGSNAALSSEYDTGREVIECESQPRSDEQSVYYMVDIDVTNQIVKVWSGYSLDEINPENIYEHPMIKLTLKKWAREDSFGVMKPFKFVDLARWRNSAGHMFEYMDAGNSSGLTGRPILRYDADLPPSTHAWFIMCQIVENTVK